MRTDFGGNLCADSGYFIDFRDEYGGGFGGGGGGGTNYGPWKLTAVTFFDPKFQTSEGITNLLEYLNAFSGNHVDILLSGCSQNPPADVPGSALIEVQVGATKRYYSASVLAKDVQELQSETSWRFSGEIDVIVLNQQKWSNASGSGVVREYKNAMVLNLYRMLNDKKITSYSGFFTELIQFATEYKGDNPAWGVSNAKLWTELKSSLFDSFKKYIGFRKFQMKVEDYAIYDISKR